MEAYFDLIIAVLSIVIGFVTSYSILKKIIKTNKLLKNGLAVFGKVVDVPEGEGDDENLYYPIVEFKTLNGQTIKEKLDGRSPNTMKVGQEIKVFYDAQAPQEFVVDIKYETTYKSYIFLFVGLIFIGVGIYKYFYFINH